MINRHFAIIHRLPRYYQWLEDSTGVCKNLVSVGNEQEAQSLVGWRLISHYNDDAREMMAMFSTQLKELHIENHIIDLENTPCLFMYACDESAAISHLKNLGVAVATTLVSDYSYC